jgi:hypothetical protein
MLLVLALLPGFRTLGQADQQFWMDYNYSLPLKGKFSLGGDVGLRGFISNYDWNQIIIRPGARYTINTLINVNASIASFYTFNRDDFNVNEFRITGDLSISWPDFEFIAFFHRFRMEKRYFFFENLPNENNWRARYLIGVESLDIRGRREGRAFYFQGHFEPLNTIGDESVYDFFVNQTRLHVVFGHKISRRFLYEVQYIWQHSRVHETSRLQTTQNIIRIRFYHRMGKMD